MVVLLGGAVSYERGILVWYFGVPVSYERGTPVWPRVPPVGTSCRVSEVPNLKIFGETATDESMSQLFGQ